MNYSIVLISLLLFNGMIVAVVRPVNILGIVVMVVAEIGILLVALRFMQK